MKWGAHAPRVPFPAPRWKHRTAGNGFDGASNPTAEGGCAPVPEKSAIRNSPRRSLPRRARAPQRDGGRRSQGRHYEIEMTQAMCARFWGWTVVAGKLNAAAALASSGALPENVNYAVKSSFLLSFLESAPDVAKKLKEPSTADRKFEDVVKSAQDAAVLVLVY